jgi:hypothetical protein
MFGLTAAVAAELISPALTGNCGFTNVNPSSSYETRRRFVEIGNIGWRFDVVVAAADGGFCAIRSATTGDNEMLAR